MKLKSFKLYIRSKIAFRKLPLRNRFLFLNLFFLFTFLLSFQNCGQKLSSNLNTNVDLSQGQQSTVTVPVAGQCSAQLNSCLIGQFIDVTDSASEYKWLCQGLNSQTAVSCGLAITRTNPPTVNAVNGQCSSVLNQCYTGTFSDVADTDTQKKWTCLGSGGGTTASCNINKPTVIVTPPLTPVNGACSTLLNQCLAGQFQDDVDTSTQNKWSCLGLNGGSNMSCTFAIVPPPNPIAGVCSSVVNQCSIGTLLDIADSTTQFKWSCLGIDGGVAATCEAARLPTVPLPLPIVPAPTSVAYLSGLDLKYTGENGDIGFDFYHPADYLTKSNLPVFIWIHGGGWSGGDKSSESVLAQKIADRGFIVLNINYTLAPVVSASLYPQPMIAPIPYTVGVRDINAVVELVKANATAYHIDLQKISLGGGSAGGHLALMASASGATTFNCVISVAGPTDLLLGTQMTQFPVTSWIIKSIFGDNEANLKAQSPLHQVNQILARRIYLMYQEKDNLVPIDHARNFVNVAKPRFNSALETNFLNDPLPAGVPYENPAPAQVTHNFDSDVANTAITNFLANKCY